jgi:hypothetical protein
MLIEGAVLDKKSLPRYTRAVVRHHGIQHSELARRIGEDVTAISHALSTKGPLRLGVCRKILEELEGHTVERIVLYKVVEGVHEDTIA